MKYLVLLTLLLTLQNCIGSGINSSIKAGKGNSFVLVEGIDLDGRIRQLPKAFTGKLNIVIVAFKREQQQDVDGWISGTENMLKKNRNLRFYEIPVIYKMNSFSRSWINNGMRRGISDEAARKRTITVYTDREKFFSLMKMKEDRIYVLLLDENGKILWRSEGKSSEKKIKFLENALKKPQH